MEYAIEARNIVKRYPGTIALKGVNFKLRKGEIRGLLGKNGAGKSTLINILAGLTRQTSGETYFFGRKAEIHSVLDSENLGFRFISQEPALMEDLSIAENIALRERNLIRGLKFIPWKKLYEDARKRLDILGMTVDPGVEVRYLSVAEKQMLLFLREIFSTGSSIVALDEVTTALTAEEAQKIYQILRRQKAQGQSFIYVSHEINEIFEVCDSATVFRDGEVVLNEEIDRISADDLKKAIVGREMTVVEGDSKAASLSRTKKPLILQVDRLANEKLKEISFELYEGEVMGVYGLRGSGRTELLKTLYGLIPASAGSVRFKDRNILGLSPSQLIGLGIGFVPEDREEGLLFGRPVGENLLITAATATNKTRQAFKWLISGPRESQLFRDLVQKFEIKTPSASAEIDYLSGGNKQKVMFGRNVASDAQLFLIDEGTKGIDIGAKQEIYQIIHKLSEQGCSMLYVSSDLDEICAVSDRIMILYGGRIVRILEKNEITKERLQHYADGLA